MCVAQSAALAFGEKTQTIGESLRLARKKQKNPQPKHGIEGLTMDDYISREAEIQFFNDWVDDLDKQINDSVNCPHLRSDYKVCKTQLLDCIHAIKEMPAADVRPVVRAKWVDVGPDMTCSACGFSCDDPWYLAEANYCPNCGADMRGETDGE
jgi:hypothetical protein